MQKKRSLFAEIKFIVETCADKTVNIFKNNMDNNLYRSFFEISPEFCPLPLYTLNPRGNWRHKVYVMRTNEYFKYIWGKCQFPFRSLNQILNNFFVTQRNGNFL